MGQVDGSYCVVAFEWGVKEKKNEYPDIADLFLKEAETFFSKQAFLCQNSICCFLMLPCADNIALQAAEEQIGFFLSHFEKSAGTVTRIKENSSMKFYCRAGIAMPVSGQKRPPPCQKKMQRSF